MMLRHLRNQRGVTLVELMVVVAIIAIIAAIAVTIFQDLAAKSRAGADNGTVAAMRSAVALYYGKNNGLFPTAATLNTLVTPSPPTFQCSTGAAVYTPANGKVTGPGGTLYVTADCD